MNTLVRYAVANNPYRLTYRDAIASGVLTDAQKHRLAISKLPVNIGPMFGANDVLLIGIEDADRETTNGNLHSAAFWDEARRNAARYHTTRKEREEDYDSLERYVMRYAGTDRIDTEPRGIVRSASDRELIRDIVRRYLYHPLLAAAYMMPVTDDVRVDHTLCLRCPSDRWMTDHHESSQLYLAVRAAIEPRAGDEAVDLLMSARDATGEDLERAVGVLPSMRQRLLAYAAERLRA